MGGNPALEGRAFRRSEIRPENLLPRTDLPCGLAAHEHQDFAFGLLRCRSTPGSRNRNTDFGYGFRGKTADLKIIAGQLLIWLDIRRRRKKEHFLLFASPLLQSQIFVHRKN